MHSSIPALDASDVDALLDARPFTVIHLDAEWDGYRVTVQQRMERLASKLSEDTSFGYMDIDRNQDHARSISLRNVPACSYSRGRELVATVVGLQQDIEAILGIVKGGGVPDTSNTISRL